MNVREGAPLLLFLLLGFCKAHPGNDRDAVDVEKEDMTTTILRMNNGSTEFMLEGDLLVPKTRTAMKCKNDQYSCLWPKSSNGKVEIPYIISDKYDDKEKSTILEAMKGFEPRTCIHYKPRLNEKVYLSIEPKYGCSSLLGRIGDKQVVSLQKFGCIDRGIIQHELMHALGFYHEHTRSDRDQYVRINWENVKEYYVQNFQKMDTDNMGIPYDYNSLMQYGKTAFGKNGLETIVPIPNPKVPIGQRDDFSKVDITRINKLYKCFGAG